MNFKKQCPHCNKLIDRLEEHQFSYVVREYYLEMGNRRKDSPITQYSEIIDEDCNYGEPEYRCYNCHRLIAKGEYEAREFFLRGVRIND